MKAPSPAFSFYPKDILSDEAAAAMTDEELGVYIRLLCHAWLEGSIPADLDRLARMTRRRRPVFEKFWKAIAPCWRAASDDPSRLVQGRLEIERAKQIAYGAVQSARARSGAKKRARPSVSRKRASPGSAVVQPGTSPEAAQSSLPSPFPSPTPLRTTEERTSAQPRGDGSRPVSWAREACDAWIERFGGTAPGGQIGKALKPLVDRHGWEIVRQAWCSYLRQVEADYASPSRFASTYGRWSGSAPPGQHARPTATEKTVAHLKTWMAAKGES